MNISGLQKMTLLDFPGHVAATVFLGGCDFRCPFCHNFEIVTGDLAPQITEEDFFDFIKKRQGILDGIVITGGEPCLRKDQLPEFIRAIKDLGFLVKLDTNGNHPQVLEDLLSQKLVDYVAMDIKNSPQKYGAAVGLTSFDVSKVDKSISLLMKGEVDYEFRTTVAQPLHEEKDFEEIGRWICGAKNYFLQQYVERDTVPDKNLKSPTEAQLSQYLEVIRKYVPSSQIRGI